MPPTEVISIIGGGPSAKTVDLTALPGTIIAVNDAALHAPRFDIAISMDRLWLENRWGDMARIGKPLFVRLSAMHNFIDRVRLSWVTPFECRHETADFGNHLCTLNGPNSGHCALNLAYVLKPKRVNLVGFDMGRGPKGECYWWPEPYPWAKDSGATSDKRYMEWRAAFNRGVDQCKVAGIDVVKLGV